EGGSAWLQLRVTDLLALQPSIEALHQIFFRRVPVLEMAAFAGLIENLARLRQLFRIFPFDNLEDLEVDVAERFNLRVPQYGVCFDLGLDLIRRELRRVGPDAVVDVPRRRNRPRN